MPPPDHDFHDENELPELPPLTDEGLPPDELPPPPPDYGSDEPAPPSDDELAATRLPQNLEAEQALLGGLLLAPEQYDLIDGHLDPEDFFAPAHGAVLSAMMELRRRGQPLDAVLLRDELARLGELDRVGGPVGLAALMGAVASGAHTEHYARIVREKATLRRLIGAATQILKIATVANEPVPAIMDFAEHAIFQVAQRGVSGDALRINQVLSTFWAHLCPMDGKAVVPNGVKSGFYRLDEMLTGFHPGELIILAARPSVGKTTFGLNVLRRIVMTDNLGAIFFSIEMSAENIAMHLLAAAAQVPAQSLHALKVGLDEQRALQRHSDALNKAPLWIDETPAISLAELRGKARRLVSKHPIKMIMIDYLQLMTASQLAAKRGREQEVSEISRGLKALAKKLNVPVMALAQLSRKSEDRKGGEPILSDLRESGAIEQDADVVMLLHRPQDVDRNADAIPMKLIVAKQRNGPTGDLDLTFRKNVLRFENPDTRERTPPPPGTGSVRPPAPDDEGF